MRQLLYCSLSTLPAGKADLPAILESCRHNNAIDGITGLLWSDATRFIQVLEGPVTSVAAAFGRIQKDERHHEIVILSDREIEDREFGSWNMPLRERGDPADAYDASIQRLLINAPADVRDHFMMFDQASGSAV